jgi:hypothetical protein
MTTRERTLAILLGGLILVLVVGVGGYAGVYRPLAARWAEARTLEDDIADKEFRLTQIQTKDMPRLREVRKRSLPAEKDTAQQEYGAALSRLLLVDAKVPPEAVRIESKPADTRSIPELVARTPTVPGRPAYTKVAYEIQLKPVDLATLIDVLRRYYQMDLLHQITKFTVKRSDRSNAQPTSAIFQDRADLEVTFFTEAIILDGAENRRTLFPVPAGMGAAGGSAGYAALLQSPEVARKITPKQSTSALAADRDYSKLLVQDIFHGPPNPPKPEPRVPEPPAPRKDDTSKFIILTGVGRNPDGTGMAIIEDRASNQQYEIDLKRKGGELVAEVVKYFRINTIKKAYPAEPILDISESTSSTARKFRVIGLDPLDPAGNSLVLAEVGGSEAPRPAAPPGGRRGAGGFGAPAPPRPAAPPPPPAGAVLGGMAAVIAPAEQIFVWKLGEPLSQVRPLSHDEAQKVVQRATAAQETVPAAGGPTVTVTAPQSEPVNDDETSSTATWAVTSPVAR